MRHERERLVERHVIPRLLVLRNGTTVSDAKFPGVLPAGYVVISPVGRAEGWKKGERFDQSFYFVWGYLPQFPGALPAGYVVISPVGRVEGWKKGERFDQSFYFVWSYLA